MIGDYLDRIRLAWDGLNEREQLLTGLMAVMLLVMLLGLPMYLMLDANWSLRAENETLQETLDMLRDKRGELKQAARERKTAMDRYDNKTPPLGSFLEAEAKKQGLALREVTDQPEKKVGSYHRRNVRASIPGVELTPTINLLSSIVSSPHPVAVDHVQIEHFQSGDSYNVKLGVLTFDKGKSRKKGETEAKDADGDTEDTN